MNFRRALARIQARFRGGEQRVLVSLEEWNAIEGELESRGRHLFALQADIKDLRKELEGYEAMDW